MRYYIRLNDEESGPYWIEDLHRALADGQVSEGTMARAENARVWKTLGQLLAEAEATAPAAKISPEPRAQKPHQSGVRRKDVRSHLVFIRAYSCYPVLRTIINVVFGLGLTVVVIGFLLQAFLLLSTRSPGPMLFYGIALIAATTLSICVMVAVRLFLLMLVDAVDSLLHEHTRNRVRE